MLYRSHAMIMQLPLSVSLKDSTNFDSYWPGPNAEAMAYLQSLTGRSDQAAVYLWGESGAGKSHLLQAVCHAAGERGAAAVYLPLQVSEQFSCDALDGLENVDMVCIDDIHAIAGNRDWELALIKLFERIHELTDGGLVITGNAPIAELGLDLPQLASRLAWGLLFQLRTLDSPDMLQALQLRASRRGFELPKETGRYLIRQCGHDMTTLFTTLESLDKASLAAKRRLTIPFIRSVLKTAHTG